LTLSLSGIIKELITMVVSEMFEDDTTLTLINWVGFAICVMGIIVHTYFKYKKSRNETPQYLELDDKSPLLESDENDDNVIFTT